MKKAISAGGVVFRAKKGNLQILLVKPFGKDKFGIPKGHIEKGETLRETAAREIFEETGVSVALFQQLKPIFVKNKYEFKAIVAYIAKPIDDNAPICGDGENASINWFDINELPPISSPQEEMIWEGIFIILNEYSREAC